MPGGLHTQLALGYLILIALVFLALGVHLTDYVRGLERENLLTRLQSQAILVADSARPALTGESPESADELADRLAQRIGSRVTIVAADGTVLGDSMADWATMENYAGRPEIAAALAGRIGSTERWNTVVERDIFAVAAPIEDDGAIIGAARVAIDDIKAASVLRDVAAVMILTLLIAGVATAALATLMARVFTRPLADLVSVTRRVSHGDLTARARIDATGEINELARAFNEMAEELQTTIDAIDEERARLEAIVEHLADGVLIIGQDGAVVLINRAAERLLSVRRQRALGRTYPEVLRDYELVEMVRRSRDGDQEHGAARTFVSLGRPRRSIQAFAYPIPSAHTPLAVVILRDITELRRTEEIRRDFVANVSHDLRTPIASLKALVETLLDGALEDGEVARDFLTRMGVEVDNLSRLVEELLELSRAESGQISLRLAEREVGQVVRTAAERLRAQAEQKNLAIRLAVPDELPLARFDAERIEQVLVNLLHNAIKFTPPGGTITAGVEPGDQTLTVFVSDTGPGIEDTVIERIFERFYKADRSRSATGSGLGLAIAKHLVQLHGGRIWAESNYGAGATLRFTLPRATAAPVDLASSRPG